MGLSFPIIIVILISDEHFYYNMGDSLFEKGCAPNNYFDSVNVFSRLVCVWTPAVSPLLWLGLWSFCVSLVFLQLAESSQPIAEQHPDDSSLECGSAGL